MIDFDHAAMLVGGIGLFLMGMMLMTDGMKVAAGSALRDILARSTRTRFRGILAGLSVTAAVQSSSATTVATIGFVNAGLLTLDNAIWVIFGSNIGSTMTGWLVALVGFRLKMEVFALPMIGVGMVVRLIGGRRRPGALGEALAGFGLFFLGLSLLKGGFDGVAGTVDIAGLPMGGLPGDLAFLGGGILMTVLMQSSAASMSIALAAASGGLIALEPAAAMVIGANIGTTSTAVLSVIGATSNARRAAASHVAFNLLTGAVAVAVLPLMLLGVSAVRDMAELTPDPATTLALFHTVFNVLGVLLMWPLARHLVHWLGRRFVTAEEDESRPRYLDETALVVPSLAIETLTREMTRARAVVARMALAALDEPPADPERLRARIAVVQNLSAALGDFARRVYSEKLPARVAEAMIHPFRILQHFEEIAETALEVSERRHAAHGPPREWEEAVSGFRRHLAGVLMPLAEEGGSGAVDPDAEIARVDDAYQSLKADLLAAGSHRRLSVAEMDEAMGLLEPMRHCAKRLLKVERRLAAIRAAAEDGQVEQPTPGSEPAEPGPDDAAAAGQEKTGGPPVAPPVP